LSRKSSSGIPDQRGTRPAGTGWTETYQGGSPEAERTLFAEYAAIIMEAQALSQRKASAHGVPHPPARTLHVKATLALEDAELRFRDDLPEELRHGFAQPGAAYRTTVRFSNAANTGEPDFKPDLRGAALRVHVDETTVHDLLMTNFAVSHARDAGSSLSSRARPPVAPPRNWPGSHDWCGCSVPGRRSGC